MQSRVGIVALAYVEQARQPADFAKVQLVKAKLSAGQGEDQTVVGNQFGELPCVVASARARSIAAADQEEVTDGAGLHGVNNSTSNAEHSVMAEADCDLLVRPVFRIARRKQSGGDYRCEVMVGDMLHLGPGYGSRCENAFLVKVNFGSWMQLEVMRIAPGNSANSCH